MWNIFEGVEGAVLEQVAGLSLETVQELMMDSADDTESQCLAHSNPPSSCSSSSSSSDNSCCCDRGRLQRSFSTTEGEAMQAVMSLQNRHRRNAVGNLFDLLTLSQKLLLVEHLQEQMERLPGFQMDEDSSMFSLAQLSSSSSSNSSSQSSGSSSSAVSSPRSQGEIVCR